MENKICGIYMIKNKINGNIYIGQAADIYERWKEHISLLRRGKHVNNHLQRAWNKYGSDNFEFSIVEECSENALNDREIYWIAEYDSYHNGYNQTLGGGGVRGFKHDEETKQRISESLKGENAPWYGKQRSEETKVKVGQASKERWSNPQNHPMYGKHHTEESKEKMSKSHKGKTLTDEHKVKLSKASSGENNPMYGVRLYGEDNPNFGNHKLAGENNPRCRAVYCYELNEYFWGAKDVANKYGFSKTGITECCRHRQQTCGKHPITGEKLHWVYADEMDNSSVA